MSNDYTEYLSPGPKSRWYQLFTQPMSWLDFTAGITGKYFEDKNPNKTYKLQILTEQSWNYSHFAELSQTEIEYFKTECFTPKEQQPLQNEKCFNTTEHPDVPRIKCAVVLPDSTDFYTRNNLYFCASCNAKFVTPFGSSNESTIVVGTNENTTTTKASAILPFVVFSCPCTRQKLSRSDSKVVSGCIICLKCAWSHVLMGVNTCTSSLAEKDVASGRAPGKLDEHYSTTAALANDSKAQPALFNTRNEMSSIFSSKAEQWEFGRNPYGHLSNSSDSIHHMTTSSNTHKDTVAMYATNQQAREQLFRNFQCPLIEHRQRFKAQLLFNTDEYRNKIQLSLEKQKEVLTRLFGSSLMLPAMHTTTDAIDASTKVFNPIYTSEFVNDTLKIRNVLAYDTTQNVITVDHELTKSPFVHFIVDQNEEHALMKRNYDIAKGRVSDNSYVDGRSAIIDLRLMFLRTIQLLHFWGFGEAHDMYLINGKDITCLEQYAIMTAQLLLVNSADRHDSYNSATLNYAKGNCQPEDTFSQQTCARHIFAPREMRIMLVEIIDKNQPQQMTIE